MGKFLLSRFADILMLTHLIWVVLLLGGTVYVFFHPEYIQWHLTIVSLTLLANLFLGHCPLTKWEEKMRRHSNPDFQYHESFAATYIDRAFGLKLTENEVTYLLFGIKFFSYLASIGIFMVRR